MSALFVLQQGNFQPRLRLSNLLQLIEVLNLLLRSLMENRVREGKEAGAGADFIGLCSGGKSLACF